jgi:hypothetical protein
LNIFFFKNWIFFVNRALISKKYTVKFHHFVFLNFLNQFWLFFSIPVSFSCLYYFFLEFSWIFFWYIFWYFFYFYWNLEISNNKYNNEKHSLIKIIFYQGQLSSTVLPRVAFLSLHFPVSHLLFIYFFLMGCRKSFWKPILI